MAIFVIGVKNINNDRYFRLYNTKAKENNIRDISEKDLMYLMKGNNNFTLENAGIKDGKITGTTGSLNKIENGICYTILGSYSENNEEAGYIYVDTMGNLYEKDKVSAVQHLQNMPIQNASIVNGFFLRGINWTIPNIKNKNIADKSKLSSQPKPIFLHVDVNLFNYMFSKKLSEGVKKQVPEEHLEKEQFAIYLENCVYSLYVPNEIVDEFVNQLRANRLTVRQLPKGESTSEIRIYYMNMGFVNDFTLLTKIAHSMNAYLKIELVRSKNQEDLSNYESQIWNIVTGAESEGLKMRKYFFLVNDALVVNNLKGYLLYYVPMLEAQLNRVCKQLGIEYRALYKSNCNYNPADLKGTFYLTDYAALEGKPYGCILMEMRKK